MTYDDLIQLGKQLTKTSGSRTERWGLLPYWTSAVDTAGGWFVVANYAHAFGTDIFNEDGTKVLVTDPKFKQAVTFMHELSFKHKISPTYNDIPHPHPPPFLFPPNPTISQP